MITTTLTDTCNSSWEDKLGFHEYTRASATTSGRLLLGLQKKPLLKTKNGKLVETTNNIIALPRTSAKNQLHLYFCSCLKISDHLSATHTFSEYNNNNNASSNLRLNIRINARSLHRKMSSCVLYLDKGYYQMTEA